MTADRLQLTALTDRIVTSLYARAEEVAAKATSRTGHGRDWTPILDRILTSPVTGFPVMLLLLGAVLWMTVVGANYPSQLIGAVLFGIEGWLSQAFLSVGAPAWIHGILVLGVYRTLAWVVSVMLPPMAIFFPCFTLLEDLGYLPRVAFNLDAIFKRAGACGKQSLTMSMGFGCNAAGVIACRIIDSPRERLIAMLTNNFIICNGRFPTLIVLSTILVNLVVRGAPGVSVEAAAGASIGVPASANIAGAAAGATTTGAGAAGAASALLSSLVVVGIVLAGIVTTFVVSWLLARTLLRGVPSFFALELPPFRRPKVGQVVVRSVMDRTIFVLLRAVTVAAPAGAAVWLLANTYIGGQSIVGHLAAWLGPLGHLMGLDGFIVAAFILGLPANEIVFPILLMSYMSTGMMIKFDDMGALQTLLVSHGWTSVTCVSYLLFSLLHWPCATTLLTTWKETRSGFWTAMAALVPTGVAVVVCSAVAGMVRAVGGAAL